MQSKPPLSAHSSKSIDKCTGLSPLEHDLNVENFVDPIIPPTDAAPFNPASVPETFDLFMNNLKDKLSKNTATDATMFKQPNSMLDPHARGSSSAFSNLKLNLNMRMLTSSVDKDLNNEALYNGTSTSKHIQPAKNGETNVIRKSVQSSNKLSVVNLGANFKTSSPFKAKIMNTTIDINQSENAHPKDGVTDMEIDSIRLDTTNAEDQQRVVFNTTYTSWTTSEQQLQLDALNQQSLFDSRANNPPNNDLTQDLNRTKDILTDDEDECMEGIQEEQPKKGLLNLTREICATQSAENLRALSGATSSSASSISVTSSTSSLSTNHVLNTTRDIVSNTDDEVSTKKCIATVKNERHPAIGDIRSIQIKTTRYIDTLIMHF